jgi:hypothetical protein
MRLAFFGRQTSLLPAVIFSSLFNFHTGKFGEKTKKKMRETIFGKWKMHEQMVANFGGGGNFLCDFS